MSAETSLCMQVTACHPIRVTASVSVGAFSELEVVMGYVIMDSCGVRRLSCHMVLPIVMSNSNTPVGEKTTLINVKTFVDGLIDNMIASK